MPDACVLDTSVASLFLNGSPQAAPYRPHLLGVEPVLSFQVVSEMRHGALLKGWGSKKQTLLAQFLAGFRIVYPDDTLLWEWAQVHGGEPESVKFCHKIGLNYVSCSPFRVPIACPLIHKSTGHTIPRMLGSWQRLQGIAPPRSGRSAQRPRQGR